MKKSILPLCFQLILLIPINSYGHAVKGSAATTTAVCAEFRFDDGEALTYADITITLPDQPLPFQNGRTDANGRFCFYPEEKATYKVKVADGMGHGMELAVLAETEKRYSSGKNEQIPFGGSWGKVIVGLSMLFGMFGLMMIVKRKPGS